VSLLAVEGVSARFRGRHRSVLAVDGVTFSLEKGQTLAIVGQSGAGKSTLAKIVAGLLRPSGGRVLLDGVDVASLAARDRSARIQLVFQDAAGALDPRMTVEASVGEPLAIRGVEAEVVRARVDEVLALVGLASSFKDRRPSALSGGERRRVGLARALVLDPALLVLDEPFAGLDLPVAAQIGSLLLEAQKARGTSHLLITHDLRMASSLASSIGVMLDGRLVELGPAGEVLARPKHPYADRLVRALPQ
jgi:ABC-type glutathione transport system ATPase component